MPAIHNHSICCYMALTVFSSLGNFTVARDASPNVSCAPRRWLLKLSVQSWKAPWYVAQFYLKGQYDIKMHHYMMYIFRYVYV